MLRMISGFDHVVIAVRDISDGVAAYEACWVAGLGLFRLRDDVATAAVATSNLIVELMAPVGPGAERLRAALEDGGEGLKSLVFATPDVERMRTRCERRLAPEAIVERDGAQVFAPTLIAQTACGFSACSATRRSRVKWRGDGARSHCHSHA